MLHSLAATQVDVNELQVFIKVQKLNSANVTFFYKKVNNPLWWKVDQLKYWTIVFDLKLCCFKITHI